MPQLILYNSTLFLFLAANQGFEQQLNEDTLDLKHASSQRIGPSHVNSQSHVANPKTSVATTTKKTNVLLPSINVNSKRDVTSKHNHNNNDVKVVSGAEAEKESRLVHDGVSAYNLSTTKQVSPKRPAKEVCLFFSYFLIMKCCGQRQN